jgi:glutamyl-tRNA synthetase/nondiscriminating glutamyl-tRNA synthetase
VVDDALMEITHVIRGDDHLSNTPKQVALYEALGWPVPQFAHLSTILGSDGQRLSKRHGATSIANFREMGVLPEALANYLALVGWAPTGGMREIFKPEELMKEFTLERVTPSAAIFDMEKLYWLNRHYIKESSPERIEKLAEPYFVNAGLLPENPDAQTRAWFGKVVALRVAAVDKLEQLPEKTMFVFRYDAAAALADPDNAETLGAAKANDVLRSFAQKVEDAPQPLTPEYFKTIMNEVKVETGVKGKELFHPVRLALTGSHSGPDFDRVIPLFEEGSRLELPHHVLHVRERMAEFRKARGL